MCLAIPLRIAAIDGATATVEMGGMMRPVSLVLTPEAQVGDYVLVHVGFAISVVDEDEARETLALFAALQEATRRADAERAAGGAAPGPETDTSP
jgi:hydrogenase expression/formation protein HypC